MRRKLSEAISADELASSAAQASASPISAIAAASDIDTFGRAAMTFWIAGWPPGDTVDQVGFGEKRRARQHDRRHFRLVGGQRADDLGGACWLIDSVSASASRTLDDGSSSSSVSAASAAQRSSNGRSRST